MDVSGVFEFLRCGSPCIYCIRHVRSLVAGTNYIDDHETLRDCNLELYVGQVHHLNPTVSRRYTILWY